MASYPLMTVLNRIAAALVRAWTWAYTCLAPAGSAEARRAEIESDLWEWQHEAGAGKRSRAWQALGRLVRGSWDDVRWVCQEGGLMRRAWLAIVAVAVAGTAISYQVSSALVISLPTSPSPPAVSQLWDFAPPSPPPSAPPPPPSRPQR